MKRTKRQKMAMALAIFVAALMLLSFAVTVIVSLMPSAQAVTQSEIKKLKDNKAALAEQKKSIQSDIKKLKNEKADAVAQKIATDQQINIINEEIDNTSLLISELTVAIAEQQAELDGAMKEEEEAYQLFRTRVRVMEESGSTTYLSIIFQSKSFSDLLDRWDMINEIMKSDQALMDDLADRRENIQAAKLQLEEDKAEQLQNRKELGERQAELAEQYAEADQLIAGLMKELSDKEVLYQQELAAEEEANKAIAKAEADLKKQQEAAKKSTKYVGGEFGWPVPGYETITSPYGMRIHPILKDKRMHNGIDIGAPKSTKIVASNAGTVILATYNSSYGNYIVIDHGGGYTTLYAHQTKFASNIKIGTQVGRGDTIGYIGSTGLSTGPHLHFEIRVNGSPKNPVDYLKAK